MATEAEGKAPSVPANYVSLAQLQQRWLQLQKQKKQQEDKEIKVNGNGGGRRGGGGGVLARPGFNNNNNNRKKDGGEIVVNKCEGNSRIGNIRVKEEEEKLSDGKWKKAVTEDKAGGVKKEEEESGKAIHVPVRKWKKKIMKKKKNKCGNGVVNGQKDEEEMIVMIVSEVRGPDGEIVVTLRAAKDGGENVPAVVAQGMVAGKTILVAGSNVSVAAKEDALEILMNVNRGQDDKILGESVGEADDVAEGNIPLILREQEDDVLVTMTKGKEVEEKSSVALRVGTEAEKQKNKMVASRAGYKLARNHHWPVNQRSYTREFGNRESGRNHHSPANRRSYIREFGNRESGKVWVTKGDTIAATGTGTGTGKRTQVD